MEAQPTPARFACRPARCRAAAAAFRLVAKSSKPVALGGSAPGSCVVRRVSCNRVVARPVAQLGDQRSTAGNWYRTQEQSTELPPDTRSHASTWAIGQLQFRPSRIVPRSALSRRVRRTLSSAQAGSDSASNRGRRLATSSTTMERRVSAKENYPARPRFAAARSGLVAQQLSGIASTACQKAFLLKSANGVSVERQSDSGSSGCRRISFVVLDQPVVRVLRKARRRQAQRVVDHQELKRLQSPARSFPSTGGSRGARTFVPERSLPRHSIAS